MSFLLALLSAFSHSLNNLSVRVYQKNFQINTADFRLFQSVKSLLTCVGYLLLSGFCLRIDGLGLSLALCYGLDLAITSILIAVCYSCGPMSVTSVISNACVVMPIAVGCLIYNETMTATRILGCVCLAGCFLLSAINRGEKKTDIQPKWYLLVFLAFVCNGMGAVLLNIYGRVAGSGERNTFLAIGYFVSALIYLADHGRLIHTTGPVKLRGFLKPLLGVLILVSALGGFAGNGLLMSLNTAMPASVLYPLVNGGIAVIVTIASCVVFHEKMTLQRFFTILLGLAAIVTLNL